MLEVQNFSMAKRPPPPAYKPPSQRKRHFIKEWRQFRRLTQEELAEETDMSPNNISQLENYRQNYSAEGLEAIAKALRCEPGHLLMFDPNQVDASLWAVWEKAKPGERHQILAVANAIVKKTGS